MAQILLNKHQVPSMTDSRGQSTITFNSNSVVGYVPLLKLFNTRSGSNDYFMAQENHGTSESIRDTIEFQSGRRVVSVRRRMRSYSNVNNPQCTVSMSMLSILGIQGGIETLYSKGLYSSYRSTEGRTALITNPVDVFVLAMIKPSDIDKIEFDRNNIKFDSSIVKLYVSKDKWKNREFLPNNYNGTLAKYLRSSVKEFTDQFDVKTEIVPDEILATYYSNPHSIESTSLSEIMEIDKQIKNKVFSSIGNKLLLVDV